MAYRGFRAGFASGVLGLCALGACQKEDHPPQPPLAARPPPKATLDGGIVVDGKPMDGVPTCGGQTIPAVVDLPLIYFVLDRSGSMGDPIDASGVTKYAAAQGAVGAVLQSVGHRVRYGAVLYPASDNDASCSAGWQVFAPTLGDALSTVPAGGRGPILRKFLTRLSAFAPGGATPTAATLAAILPTVPDLGGRTSLVLVTDGAPNCDVALSCPSAACIPDIEGSSFQGERCGPGHSCCDPTVIGAGAGGNCIDSDATEAAVTALRAAGIDTYVIGMPGSEAYASLLERLALAGGTARAEAPAYYAVSAASSLTAALLEIGTGLTIQCEIALEAPPDDPALVNLYFDKALVAQDPENGWDWTSETAVSVRGDACETLRSGAIREVDIVYGCETVVR